MKLTFCIPSFGSAKYLIQSLESIRNQTIPCRSVVCFGGDAPKEIQNYCNNTPNVDLRIIQQDPGMVACWNIAASEVKTDYCSFLADDNTVCPSFAASLTSLLEENSNAGFAFGNQNHMDADGTIDPQQTQELQIHFARNHLTEGLLKNESIPDILNNDSIPLEASVFRTKLVQKFGKFENDAYGAFDIEFINRLLSADILPYYHNDNIMNFRWHDDAYCSRQRRQHLEGILWVYDSLAKNQTSYRQIFLDRASNLRPRRLRYPMDLMTRIRLSSALMINGQSIEMLKQNIAKLINRP